MHNADLLEKLPEDADLGDIRAEEKEKLSVSARLI